MKATVRKSSVHKQTKDNPPCVGCVFDESTNKWFINVETIDDLLGLPSHEIIIASAMQDDDFDMYIELYDDYRE